MLSKLWEIMLKGRNGNPLCEEPTGCDSLSMAVLRGLVLMSTIEAMKLALVLLFFLMTGTSSVFAKSECDKIFRVGGSNFEPLYYAPDGKRYVGIVADLVQELKRRTQCDFKVEPMTRARLLSALKLSQIDLIIAAGKNSAFDEYGEFLLIYETQREVVVWGDIALQDRSFEKLMANPTYKFLLVSTTNSFYSKHETDLLMKQRRLISTPDLEGYFALFAKGSSIVVVGMDFLNTFGLRMQNITGKVTRFYDVGGPRIKAGIYYAPSRVNSKEVKLLSETLNSIHKDGTFRKIINKYVTGEVLMF